jgi:hypothetical protein
LRAHGELGLALGVDLRVEDLVLQVGRGLRLEENARAGGLDDLVALAGPWRGSGLQGAELSRAVDGGRDPQTSALALAGSTRRT